MFEVRARGTIRAWPLQADSSIQSMTICACFLIIKHGVFGLLLLPCSPSSFSFISLLPSPPPPPPPPPWPTTKTRAQAAYSTPSHKAPYTNTKRYCLSALIDKGRSAVPSHEGPTEGAFGFLGIRICFIFPEHPFFLAFFKAGLPGPVRTPRPAQAHST